MWLRTRRYYLVALFVFLSTLSPFTFTAYGQSNFDVGIGEIQITQGIQTNDPRFWILPLVAERNIAVRVHVERISGIPGPVTGTLKVWVDGQEITPPGGVNDINRNFPAPHNSFIPPAGQFASLVEFEENTLNFELLAADYPVAPPGNQIVSNDVDFEVQIFAAGDTNPANNVKRVEDLPVERRGAPWLFKDRVFWLPPGGPASGAARPRESFIVPGKGDVMAPAVWPIPDAPTNTGTQTNPIFAPILPSLTYTEDCDGDQMITTQADCLGQTGRIIGDEQGILLHRLTIRRQILLSGGFSPDRLVYLFGWVREGNLAGHDGVALRGQNVGYGIDAQDRGQMVFAHEFGHMVGLDHNMPGRTVDEQGWDVGARLHDNPLPMHGLTGRVKPPHQSQFTDIMNSNPLATTSNTWIDRESYTALLTDPKLAAESANLLCERGATEDYETLLVYGVPAREEAGTRMRISAFRYPWCIDLPLEPRQPNLVLTLQVQEPRYGKIETIQVPFDARMITELPGLEDDQEELGPFAVPIPVLKATQLISVQVDSLEREFLSTELVPSKYTPEISIASPVKGDKLGAETEIAWVADDKDEDATLSYDVLYSPDNGRSFVPVEVDLDETSITIDGTQLPATESGSGLLRIVVNDGANTSYADVGGLSIEDGGVPFLQE